ncbi:putative alpha/beta hydrolase-1 [Helianthus debilis subsp. tardiflorus]
MNGVNGGPPPYTAGVGFGNTVPRVSPEDWRFHATEFAKGVAELSVEFGKGCRDVVKQSILRDDSFVVRNFGGPCKSACMKLRFLNRYLPEDRDPMHSWSVISFVFAVVIAVLIVTSESDAPVPMIQKLHIYPGNATRILLPDGRHLAYHEQGVSSDRARYTIVTSHSFLSSRLAGIPGIKASLLEEFGVRLVTYDLPGFGESDPHPGRNLESSAMDLFYLSYAVHITDKFWVVGYSGASLHTWAALKYIPDRIAGAFMVAPLLNPYEPSMNKVERRRTWEKWTLRRKFMYFLARKFPVLLPYFYRRSFLSGNLDQIDKWLALSLGKRDKVMIEELKYQEFWKRDLGESVRQGNVKPFVEEAVLQVSNWGFSISDLNVQKKLQGKGIVYWLKSIYKRPCQELTGFLGPIHIWQGLEDRVVPPSMSEYVHRVLPGAMVHKLLYEGHFTYFYFCDECHRQMLTTVFGNPQGPLPVKVDPIPVKVDPIPVKADPVPVNEDTDEETEERGINSYSENNSDSDITFV